MPSSAYTTNAAFSQQRNSKTKTESVFMSTSDPSPYLRKGQKIISLSSFLLPLSVVVYSERRLVPTPNIEGQGLSSYHSLVLPSNSTNPALLDLPEVKSLSTQLLHSWRHASFTITTRCETQGEKNSFQGQGKITGKNVIFETIFRSRRVASNSAFHEVCVRSEKKSGDSEIFLLKTNGNL